MNVLAISYLAVKGRIITHILTIVQSSGQVLMTSTQLPALHYHDVETRSDPALLQINTRCDAGFNFSSTCD